jgi:hypothetical protein
MQDARFLRSQAVRLRSQAEMCLEVAQRISDRNAAESLRGQAAQYFARAIALEGESATSDPAVKS